ncbi:MAG: NADH-quinone oxidoreductase subunit NuoF [Oscillospiraceae bacterium]|jgi:NADH:ubiquinone oxidoreductase subunit F (NADH-binding)/(2Fe-2S) ferredoxin/Pyruvate/2-oxoacid:ferredoxin oxidoreductase delta subunit|nr:NADH-quinone oxidoreductase subunit NuoF [Oscillospiraceae bacterium]
MTATELNVLRDSAKAKLTAGSASGPAARIVVGYATCGIAAGAKPVLESLKKELADLGLTNVSVEEVGCIGMCQYEPIVEVYTPGAEKVTYVKMTAGRAARVVSSHIANGKVVAEYTIGAATGEAPEGGVIPLSETAFYKKQRRAALRNCGVINPESLEDYIAMDGYQALAKALTSMQPGDVIQVLKDSGLRGRGGGGFPTGTKWSFTAAQPPGKKYVVCNADEGDPGAFMDRSVLEGDPHSVVEAMALCGFATGSDEGYVYVRAEYPIAVLHLEKAIADARAAGLLGKNILGTDFSFDLHIRLGAGAFVCGEETALMTSIEGNRGEPRPRPPYPAIKGLFGKPTTENNVETFANVPQIILRGAEHFNCVGTEKSKGTKVFALGGKITNTGLVEIPMGTTLREIIEEIGGGIPNGKRFKAAQTGGPSGGCIPEALIDTPVDYDNLSAIGSMMGSGGLIVMDEDNCMVDMARFFLDFTVDESCGKCNPCRIGTKRMMELLEKITEGNATLEDLDKLEELAYHIKENSLCGLGQTAPNPVLANMRHFRDEFVAHVVEKKCRAGVCKALLNYYIIPEKCKGCTACKRVCPVNAITGNVKEPHVINTDLCIKCGACQATCKFGAIIKQ